MADFHEEVVVEILSRLPVESLMRFKCVCKSWYALLKNQKFVAKHHANQSKKHILLKRFCPQKKCNVLSILSSGDDDVSSVVDVDLPTHKEERFLEIVGHCDGIVVLANHLEEVIACNPAIREFRTLPKSSFHPYPQNCLGCFGFPYTDALGFGYDSQTKSHKVVRVLGFASDMNADGSAHLFSKAEVFSLTGGSSWREISDAVVGARAEDSNHLKPYCNGVFYWWAFDYDKDICKHVILSFDLADEVFRKAPVPDLWANSIYGTSKYIMVYNNGSMGFISHQYGGSDIEMWVMKEFGVKESWTKFATIGLLQGFGKPLAFRNNDEELLLETKQGQLVVYDLVTLEAKDLPIIYGTPRYWGAATYMKTLVSVNGQTREDIVS